MNQFMCALASLPPLAGDLAWGSEGINTNAELGVHIMNMNYQNIAIEGVKRIESLVAMIKPSRVHNMNGAIERKSSVTAVHNMNTNWRENCKRKRLSETNWSAPTTQRKRGAPM